jgi:hypothetical protein
MPRTCTICRHPKLNEINEAVVSSVAYRDIAGRYGTSKSALDRHKPHVSRALMKAKGAAEVVQADSLMDKIAQLEQEARRLGRKAEDAGDLRAAMAAVRELVRIVELLAKLQGEIKEPGGTTVNVVYVNAPHPCRSDKQAPTVSCQIVDVLAARSDELVQE